MRGPLCTAIVACAVMLVGTGSAEADTQVVLPDGHGQFTTRDGVTVQVDRSGEHVTVSPSIASSPLSRNVWVSGVTSVSVDVPVGITVTGGRIQTGYLVGCQVDLGSGVHADASGDAADKAKSEGPDKTGGDAQAGGGGNTANSGGGGNGGGGLTVGTYNLGGSANSSGITPYADPDMSLQLKPGKVATKQIETYNFSGTSGTTQYVDHTLSIDGCAGYAEARSYMTIFVQDNVMDASQTLWGQPFSLG
ncbi:MspA family porin [Nocardia sp. 2YAB30]|uniref:MspA family porin n=1 Tax=unclassified Nocardia TaxID=2637762 RepID=UPI003F9D7469